MEDGTSDEIPMTAPTPTFDRSNPEHVRRLVEALGGSLVFEDVVVDAGLMRQWVAKIGAVTYAGATNAVRLEQRPPTQCPTCKRWHRDIDDLEERPVRPEVLDRELAGQAAELILGVVAQGGAPRVIRNAPLLASEAAECPECSGSGFTTPPDSNFSVRCSRGCRARVPK